jgi:hypothetical protein
MHILADPPPLPDTVPKDLAAVVDKLLGKEPPDRYADAREARRALASAYALPSKITGVVGLAAVAHDDPTDPPMVMPVMVAGPPGAEARAPTGAQAGSETPAEPWSPSDASDLFVRSGGTMLAPPSGLGSAPTSTSQGVMPVPVPSSASSTSQGVMLLPMSSSAQMSRGAMSVPMSSAASSLGLGSVPIVPASASTPPFDPLAVSSPGLPAVGPGLYGSGAHPRSGIYGAMPPNEVRRRSGTAIVVVLLLVTWVAIGVVWWASRDSARPGPTGITPAAGPAAEGRYRFADDADPAKASDSSPVSAPDAVAWPPGDTKKHKKLKKPKHDEDEDD